MSPGQYRAIRPVTSAGSALKLCCAHGITPCLVAADALSHMLSANVAIHASTPAVGDCLRSASVRSLSVTPQARVRHLQHLLHLLDGAQIRNPVQRRTTPKLFSRRQLTTLACSSNPAAPELSSPLPTGGRINVRAAVRAEHQCALVAAVGGFYIAFEATVAQIELISPARKRQCETPFRIPAWQSVQ